VRKRAPITVRRRVYLKIKPNGLARTSIKENLYVIRLTTVLRKKTIACCIRTRRRELKVVDQEALGVISRGIIATRESRHRRIVLVAFHAIQYHQQ